MSGLPSFPSAATAPETPAPLSARGYRLRPATDADLPPLMALYADTRADELAAVPWPAEFKRDFLAQQFGFQHRHYLGEHPDADYLVIEHAGRVVGRYYLRRQAPDHHVIDICLVSGHRGGGIGRALIEASQREARASGCGMALEVMVGNPRARELYERLGFVPVSATDTHVFMVWPGPAA